MLRPNKSSFLYLRFFYVAVFFLFLFLFSAVLSYYVGYSNFWVGFFLLGLYFLIVFNLFFVYRKENYDLSSSRFKVNRGSFFSDYSNELVVKNIVQVSLKLPYLEYLFFGTGSVFVKAAGSSGSEVVLRNVKSPKLVYNKVLNIMKSEGFTLSKDKLLVKDKPNSIAVFLEVFGEFVFGAVFFFFFYFSFFLDLITEGFSLVPLVLLLCFIAVFFVVRSVLKFLDLKIRTYYLYEDTIYFEDGFLTQNFSFIPIENLSDTDLTQSFLDKVLDLYDLRISSKGLSNEIVFSNIDKGPLFEEKLSFLIKSSSSLVGEKKASVVSSKKKEVVSSKRFVDGFVSFKMNKFRSFVSLGFSFLFIVLLLFLFVGFVIFNIGLGGVVFFMLVLVGFSWFSFLVKRVVDVFSYSFSVSGDKFESVYSFLTKRTREFSLDKIVFFEVLRNPFDRYFDTGSVSVMSIGSGESLNFDFVDMVNVEKAKSFLGYDLSGAKSVDLGFGFKSFLMSNLLLSFLFFGGFLVSLLLGFFVVSLVILLVYSCYFVYSWFFYKKVVFLVGSELVYFKRGIFFVRESFGYLGDVKGVNTSKYPLCTEGRVDVIVSGEVMVNQKDNVMKSNGFSCGFVSNVVDFHLFMDKSLGVTNFSEEKSFVPDAKNSLILSSLPLFTLIYIPFYFIIAPVLFVIWRRKVYVVEAQRVVFRRGVFYFRQKSVLISKIDHIANSKGFLNKVCGNGNVLVFTLGSSMPDLVLSNFKEYGSCYDLIEKKYK